MIVVELLVPNLQSQIAHPLGENSCADVETVLVSAAAIEVTQAQAGEFARDPAARSTGSNARQRAKTSSRSSPVLASNGRSIANASAARGEYAAP